MNASSHSIGSRWFTVAMLAGVFVLYGVTGFALYRGRGIHWFLCNSDLVIFAVPFLSAFAANAYVLFSSTWWRSRSTAKLIGIFFISFALASVAWYAYMLCAVDTYGE